MLSNLTADRRQAALAAAASAAAVGAWYLWRARRRAAGPRPGPHTPDTLPKGAYDVAVVGAGPGGGVCAWYLARGGARVALLEKERFPRDKVCGDAVCTPGVEILTEMGVLQAVMAAGEGKRADSGGFVSPSGLSYIGASVHELQSRSAALGGAAAVAVRRTHLDERIARAAAAAGADLREGFEVGDAVAYDAAAGLWTVAAADGRVVRARALVCADGSTSRLATRLGLVTEPAAGVSSRAYIEPPHNANFDGVCFYPRWSLPGYAAIFRHTEDLLGFNYYLIPCSSDYKTGQLGRAHADDLRRLHERALKSDPFISRAVGPHAKVERMRAAALRAGSQGVPRSYADAVVIVGDAAGHVDPLTGEGIHTAMLGGRAAAAALLAARAAGNYSAEALAPYEAAWKARFGHDFWLSNLYCRALCRWPILLDALANEVARTGDAMMARWAEVATCMRPKAYLLRPDVAAPLALALLRELWAQKVVGRPDAYAEPEDPKKLN